MAKKKNWIKSAIKKPGALHKDLGVPAGKPIGTGKVTEATKSTNPKTAARARFALILLKMKAKKGKKKTG